MILLKSSAFIVHHEFYWRVPLKMTLFALYLKSLYLTVGIWLTINESCPKTAVRLSPRTISASGSPARQIVRKSFSSAILAFWEEWAATVAVLACWISAVTGKTRRKRLPSLREVSFPIFHIFYLNFSVILEAPWSKTITVTLRNIERKACSPGPGQ